MSLCLITSGRTCTGEKEQKSDGNSSCGGNDDGNVYRHGEVNAINENDRIEEEPIKAVVLRSWEAAAAI